MQAIAKIKAILEQRPNQYIPSIRKFHPLDLDVLSNQLKLSEKAKARGQKNQPNSDATELDSIETEIINTIEAEKNRDYSLLLDQIHAYEDRITALNLDNVTFKIKSAAENAISEFEAEARDGINQLENDMRQVQELHQERNDFRKKNGLDRTARYPESRIFHISIIMVLFLIESILNANFLAIGLENGILGGFIEALAISTINIFVSLGAGIFLYPRVNHKYLKWRMFGWISILIYLAIMILFNLLVAHYRLALASNQPEFASTLALQTLINDPINLPDFHSWIMIFIGCIFSVTASIDGFKMNDPYPGYSNLDKRYKLALDDYSNHHADIIDNLREIKDESISDIHQSKNTLSEQRTNFENIMVSRQSLINAFDQRIHYLQDCARHLLNIYRDENIESRTTKPPLYFTQQFILQSPRKIDTPAHYFDSQKKLETNVDEIYSELDLIIKKMHSEFTVIQKRFPLLNELFREI
ncbi:hypothetical protein FOLKNPGA_01742 [Legionella sp. PC1000]|uniref:hypothetical protein n=1 Tax=Legionella sp. PC1000 TaxID=2746060 RepID=UPI0015FD3C5F|nr:hypothetical protein [Legionella sp. PC1000]QLZ68962.1 hypothetical protein FOLKNPGA_01742 [Legionella sp. PC1000]